MTPVCETLKVSHFGKFCESLEVPNIKVTAVLTVQTGFVLSVCHLALLTPQPSITAMKRQQQGRGNNSVLQSEPKPANSTGNTSFEQNC